MIRSIIFSAFIVLSIASSLVLAQPASSSGFASPTLSGQQAANQCLPPNQIRLYVLTQTSGPLASPLGTQSSSQQFFNQHDIDLQFAFANSLAASVNQLNSANQQNSLSGTTYPGFDGTNQKPSLYQANEVRIGTYAGTTGSSAAVGAAFNDASGSATSPTISSVNTVQTPNLVNGLQLVVDELITNANPNNYPGTVYPHPGTVRIAVVIHDGAAWDAPPANVTQSPYAGYTYDFSNDYAAGFDNNGKMIPQGTVRYNEHVEQINRHYKKARCVADRLAEAGVHVIYVNSNRSSLVGQGPIASFASTNKQYGNGPYNGNSNNRNAFSLNQNQGNVQPYDVSFNNFDDLMTDSVLGPVSALIRQIATPGPAAASSCVVSGDPHITTFDGLHYDYKGIGDYWLFRSLRTTDPFVVQYRAGPCADSSSCVVGVAVSDGNDLVEVVITDRSGNYKNAYASYNGARIALTDFTSQIGQQQFGNVLVTVRLLGTSSYSVKIAYAAGHTVLIQRNLVIVTPGPHLYGRSAGMCGNWNGCAADDFLDSCGQVATLNQSQAQQQSTRFGDSWTVSAGESLFTSAPAQGVSGREILTSPVCNVFNPYSWVGSPSYNRWPYLPAYTRDVTATGSPTPAITTYGQPDLSQVTPNNQRLTVLSGAKSFSAFQIPSFCAKLRGALLSDCIADYGSNNGIVDSTVDVLFRACVTYCKTGRFFTNLVSPSDCVGAGLCNLASNQPDLHVDYQTTSYLPDVTFGNQNQPSTFFQPTLGLSGSYFLEVAESDLCGVSRKVEQIDVRCSTPNPTIVLTYQGFVNPTNVNGSAVGATFVDPLVPTPVTVMNAIPDPLAGYPVLTIQASVFPASNILGQSWRFVQYPTADLNSNSYPGQLATPSGYGPGLRSAPLLEGDKSTRLRFQPTLPGTYVLEYAVWTGCSVSRQRTVIYAACSVQPPSASIEALVTSYTNGNTQVNSPRPSTGPNGVNVAQNNVAISWAPYIAAPTVTTTDPLGAQTGVQYTSRWMPVTLQASTTFDVDTPKKMLTYTWSVRQDRVVTGTASLDNIKLLSQTVTTSPYTPQTQGGFPSVQTCSSSSTTTGFNQLPLSTIQSQSRSRASTLSGASRTTVQLYGLVPTGVPSTADSSYGPVGAITSLPQVINVATLPLQTFSASSSSPATGVSPFTGLYNAYRQTTTTSVSTVSFNEHNITTQLPTVLCRVTLTELFTAAGDSRATLLVEEVGDTPRPFGPPVNYCKDATYTVGLTVNDECQSSTDSVVLTPTCDGYTQAIVECDQYIYWDNTNQNFPTATIDATQSYDEMFNTPNNSTYSVLNGVNAIGQPAGRSLYYQFTNDAMTPSPVGVDSRFTHSYGFTQVADQTKMQTIVADVPGVYSTGVVVSNRCAQSNKVTGTVTFSCQGAAPCDAVVTQTTTTQTTTNPTPTTYTVPITSNWVGKNTYNQANASLSARQVFEYVTIDQSTSSATSVSHTPALRQRWKVTSAPTGSAYRTTTDKDFQQLTMWQSKDTAMVFYPDALGQFIVEAHLTDSCGCTISKVVITINTLCLTTPYTDLKILFKTIAAYNLAPSAPGSWSQSDDPLVGGTTPTAFQSTNPYVNGQIIIGTPYSNYPVNSGDYPVTWTITPPSGASLTTSQAYFVYTPSVIGTYTVKIDSTDGCRAKTNSTQFTVVAVPTPTNLCQSPAPDANFVVPGANGPVTTKADQTIPFKTWALPKATLVANGGGFNNGFDYNPAEIEWSIISAPVDSIYSAGTYIQLTNVSNRVYQDWVTTPVTNKFDPTTNSNIQTNTHRSWNTTVVYTAVTKIIIPILAQTPPISVWGGVTYSQTTFGEQFGPLRYRNEGTFTGVPVVLDYTGLHSQACVTLDRPGQYIFQLRYLNLTSPTCVKAPVTLTYNAVCNTEPTATITVSPSATPTLTAYNPLRVTVTAVGADVDAGDAALLTYAWSFVGAPNMDQPFTTTLNQRANAQNYTQLTQPQLNTPNENSYFPPLFNPHQNKVHFLAIIPGNYTLVLKVSDGCNVKTYYQYIQVGCASPRNQYGSINAPVVPTQASSIATPIQSSSYTITDAVGTTLPLSATGTNPVANPSGDVTVPLATQWRIVGFTPFFQSNVTLQQGNGAGAPGTFSSLQN